MRRFQVVGWEKFQHYHDRNPPWIKLHNTLLENYEFATLPDAAKAHLMLIWILASRMSNSMPFDPRWVQNQISAKTKVNLNLLQQAGFIAEIVEHDASKPLELSSHDASESLPSRAPAHSQEGETERETEAETEKRGVLDGLGFEDFWSLWPRKVGKSAAVKAWNKLSIVDRTAATGGRNAQLKSGLIDSSRYTPHASTWLNGRRWEDDPKPAPERTAAPVAAAAAEPEPEWTPAEREWAKRMGR